VTTIAVPMPAAEMDAEPPASTGKALGWWGMIALIATEATVFALLLFAYFYLRFNAARWPLGDVKSPELFKSGLRTIVLLGSSIPMHVAERGIKQGNRRVLVWGMTIGWIMGALFLVGHVQEYIDLWPEFRPTTNAYGSAFYTITGLHALHLIVGLVMTGWVLFRARRGHYDEHRHLAVENSILYWHFVDAVWIAVFTSLYLSVSWA
jgi:heme/copper-type cytochrome/quinol oxidase subunit 3